MSDFSVNTVILLKEADILKLLKKELGIQRSSLDRIRHSLILSGPSGNSIKQSLSIASGNLGEIVKNLQETGEVLSTIASDYEKTE